MRNLRLELGVVLVVCAFSAAAAYAQQAVERPFKMTGHSQVVITFSPDCNPYVATFPFGCRYEGHGQGVASHLGEITTTDIGFFPRGSGEIVGANGDRLLFVSNNATGLMTITGGTGRFQGASGAATGALVPDAPPVVDPIAGTLTQTFSWNIEGTITY